MKTYLVGRDHHIADIVITDADHSVSNIHLELKEESNGKYCIIDCNTFNATFRKQGGRWAPVKQTYVYRDDLLLLGGKYQTSVRKLLSMRKGLLTEQLKKTSHHHSYIGVRRDPKTGVIMPRRF
ncbi:MAG: FHA domain-containing protein [Thiomargarita sp.]|nr:FHA domain-containing protein [Thiomargarita sp.]